jgi:hypothetical protein
MGISKSKKNRNIIILVLTAVLCLSMLIIDRYSEWYSGMHLSRVAIKDSAEASQRGEASSRLSLSTEGKKAKVSIYCDIPDGAVFEICITNDQLQSVSSMESIKDGKIDKYYDVPDSWGPSYISCTAFLCRNHKGENVRNGPDGSMMIEFKPVTAAYPDADTVKSAIMDDYKNACKAPIYGELKDDAVNAAVSKVKVTGKVIRFFENGDYDEMQLDITKSASGAWKNSVYVIYDGSGIDAMPREGDVAEIYGEVRGMMKYRSGNGYQRDIPCVYARYIYKLGEQ